MALDLEKTMSDYHITYVLTLANLIISMISVSVYLINNGLSKMFKELLDEHEEINHKINLFNKEAIMSLIDKFNELESKINKGE